MSGSASYWSAPAAACSRGRGAAIAGSAKTAAAKSAASFFPDDELAKWINTGGRIAHVSCRSENGCYAKWSDG